MQTSKTMPKMSKEEIDEIYEELQSQIKQNDELLKQEVNKTRKERLDEYLDFVKKNKCKTRGGKNGK